MTSFDACIQSPCKGCTAPCCTFLPLHDFTLRTYRDVDYARYLLNFVNIELALVQGATWRVHWKARCTRLLSGGGCSLHNTPQKPQVCLNYDAYSCFYKPMFLQAETPEFLRFDAVRFQALIERLEFDSAGAVTTFPDSHSLMRDLPSFVDHPYEEIPVPKPRIPAGQVGALSTFQSQCEGCAAWCCQTISFPFGGVHSVSNLDYIWFSLGFPGVELAMTAEGMSVFVHSRCRNLKSMEKGGCKVFGTSARPLVCQQYDGMNCAYKVQVGTVDPQWSLRIGLSDFETFQRQFQFDVAGQCIERSTFEVIRDRVRENRTV